MNYLRKLISHQSFFHISFWTVLYFLTLLAVYRYEGISSAWTFSLFLVAPLVVPIYLHLYIFNLLFLHKKYFLYGLGSITIVIVFGYLNELFLNAYYKNVEIETYLTLILFIAMFTGFKYLRIGSKQQYQLQLEEKKRIKTENELLRSQVNPHFLFNTLNSIYSLIIAKNDNAGDAVLKLSELMRYLLDNSQRESVSLAQEHTFILNYIELEKIRLGGRCQIRFELNGNLDGKHIAPMILIPFVENAFKHGISATPDKNYITIRLDENNNEIHFSVENFIAPKHITSISKPQKNKLGIENVTQRLRSLYPGKHKLLINSENSVFRVELKIEL